MNKETYIKMTQPFRDHPKLAKRLSILNKICTGIIYVTYPIFLVYLALENPSELLFAITVPLDGFIILSVFRYLINRQRPYEKFEMPAVIPKNKKGQSFPSRHVFSAFVIALTICECAFSMSSNLLLAFLVFLIIDSFAVAVVRVISGVHFISDVVVGAGFALFCTFIGGVIF